MRRRSGGHEVTEFVRVPAPARFADSGAGAYGVVEAGSKNGAGGHGVQRSFRIRAPDLGDDVSPALQARGPASAEQLGKNIAAVGEGVQQRVRISVHDTGERRLGSAQLLGHVGLAPLQHPLRQPPARQERHDRVFAVLQVRSLGKEAHRTAPEQGGGRHRWDGVLPAGDAAGRTATRSGGADRILDEQPAAYGSCNGRAAKPANRSGWFAPSRATSLAIALPTLSAAPASPATCPRKRDRPRWRRRRTTVVAKCAWTSASRARSTLTWAPYGRARRGPLMRSGSAVVIAHGHTAVIAALRPSGPLPRVQRVARAVPDMAQHEVPGWSGSRDRADPLHLHLGLDLVADVGGWKAGDTLQADSLRARGHRCPSPPGGYSVGRWCPRRTSPIRDGCRTARRRTGTRGRAARGSR